MFMLIVHPHLLLLLLLSAAVAASYIIKCLANHLMPQPDRRALFV